MSRAICQYLLFTPEGGASPQWLPQPPSGKKLEADTEKIGKDSTGVQLYQLSIVNGQENLFTELGINNNLAKSSDEEIVTKKVSSKLYPILFDVNDCSHFSLFLRHSMEPTGIFLIWKLSP